MNLIESLLGTARNRLSNPLAGSFILSWLVINWKVGLVLLSSKIPNEEKINLLTNADYFNIFNLLWCPLGFGVFLTIALPAATWGLEQALNKIEERRLKGRYNVTSERAKLDKLYEGIGTVEGLQKELERALTEISEKDGELTNAHTKIEELSVSQKILEDNRRLILDEASDPKYEKWKIEVMDVLRLSKDQETDGTTYLFGYISDLLRELKNSDGKALLGLKGQIVRDANYSETRHHKKKLSDLASIIPTHPDEV